MKRFITLTIMAMVMLTLVAKEKVILVCEEYPPYEYIRDGKPVGSDIDVIDKVCEVAGLDYEIIFTSWKRCLYMVSTETADGVFALRKTQERTRNYLFTTKPINKDKRIIVTSSKYTGNPIKSLKDLNGKTVGVVSGYSYSVDFDNDKSIKRDFSVDSKMLINKFLYDRHDIIASNELVFKYYMGTLLKSYKIHPYVISSDDLYIAFNKNSKLYKKFNDALELLYRTKKLPLK